MTLHTPNTPATPRAAATVVLLRPGPGGPEVLLTQRPATMAFAAEMFVFPGGAVDPTDRDERVAAIRELFEEAGVLLAHARAGTPTGPTEAALAAARARLLEGSASLAEVARELGLDPQPDLLAPLSRWVTPPFVERRFDVRFFAAELPAGASVSFVGDEVVAHRWRRPGDALRERAEGRIGLWVPTSVTLQQLEHVRSFAEIRDRLAPGDGPAGQIRVVDEDTGIVRIALPGAGGVAGQSVNAWVVGTREAVVVDPGDPSDDAAETILDAARGRGATIAGIVLTSAAPDHHAGAEALAGRIGAPVFAGRGAARSLPYDVRELADGDAVPVGDAGLRVIATPGPRPDAVSLVGDGFVLVGDLVGPDPSRSIPGRPDRAAWTDSLERVGRSGAVRVLAAHD